MIDEYSIEPYHDPTICFNCNCPGDLVDSIGFQGEYVCPNCGDEWNIYREPDDYDYTESNHDQNEFPRYL